MPDAFREKLLARPELPRRSPHLTKHDLKNSLRAPETPPVAPSHLYRDRSKAGSGLERIVTLAPPHFCEAKPLRPGYSCAETETSTSTASGTGTGWPLRAARRR